MYFYIYIYISCLNPSIVHTLHMYAYDSKFSSLKLRPLFSKISSFKLQPLFCYRAIERLNFVQIYNSLGHRVCKKDCKKIASYRNILSERNIKSSRLYKWYVALNLPPSSCHQSSLIYSSTNPIILNTTPPIRPLPSPPALPKEV